MGGFLISPIPSESFEEGSEEFGVLRVLPGSDSERYSIAPLMMEETKTQ